MGRILLFMAAGLILLMACSKSKFKTSPSLSLKSISSKTIPINGNMHLELEYTDKEGDIQNDTLIYIKVRNNINALAPDQRLPDTINLSIPDFPKKSEGIIDLLLTYELYLKSAIFPPPNGSGGFESDSLTMKFILKDNADHHSDTLVINDVVIERTN